MSDLLNRSAAELDELFVSSEVADLPHGTGHGEVLILTGTKVARPLAWFARVGAWRGKQFAADGRSLRNLITPFGVQAIAAEVGHGESRIDGKACIVLDYSKTSWVAKWIRDEIREYAPGRFIGVVFLRSKKLPVRFALSFDSAQDSTSNSLVSASSDRRR